MKAFLALAAWPTSQQQGAAALSSTPLSSSKVIHPLHSPQQLGVSCSCFVHAAATVCFVQTPAMEEARLGHRVHWLACCVQPLGSLPWCFCRDSWLSLAEGTLWQTYRGGVQPLWSLPWCFWRDSCWGPASASAAAAPLWAAAAQSGGWGLVGTDSQLSSILAFSTDLQQFKLHTLYWGFQTRFRAEKTFTACWSGCKV